MAKFPLGIPQEGHSPPQLRRMYGFHKFGPPIPPALGPAQRRPGLCSGGHGVETGLHLSAQTVGETLTHTSPSWHIHHQSALFS